ncbi:MAG TPA: cytochrome c biogenesis protein CcsA, partial [Ktedonobacterales bacterium]|nr:cytochrome c biogenesis protein CcsA [Ktedonobacterales bacterium]
MSIARDAAPAAAPPASAGARMGALLPRTRGEKAFAVLGLATAIGMVVSIWAIFAYAPEDALSGVVQRIFYFHVPVAWDAYLAFFTVFVASIMYLWRRDERWDWLARAAAEIGTELTTLVLITGSLWGKPIWGTWWTWDARLTSTLFLWFIYVGYLILRGAVEDPGMRARYS